MFVRVCVCAYVHVCVHVWRCSMRVCVRASLLVCMFARRIVSYCIYFRGDMRANDKGCCDTHNNVIGDTWWLQYAYIVMEALHVFCPVFAVSNKAIGDDGPSLAMTHMYDVIMHVFIVAHIWRHGVFCPIYQWWRILKSIPKSRSS